MLAVNEMEMYWLREFVNVSKISWRDGKIRVIAHLALQ